MFFKNRGTTGQADFSLYILSICLTAATFDYHCKYRHDRYDHRSGLPSEDDHKLVVEAIKKIFGEIIIVEEV